MNDLQSAVSRFSTSGIGSLSWATVAGVSAALMLGTFIILGMGFAGADVMHNAAHDMRHGLAFPCH